MSRDVTSKGSPFFIAAQAPSRRRIPAFALSLTSLTRGSQLDAACSLLFGYRLPPPPRIHRHACPFHFCHPALFSQPLSVSLFSRFGFPLPALSIDDLLPGCSARYRSICLVGLLLPQSVSPSSIHRYILPLL